MSHYYFTIADPSITGAEFPFASHGAEGMAGELQSALTGDALFQRWKAKQQDPDAVNPRMALTDPAATVRGAQRDLQIDLEVVTTLPSEILRHRLRLLAGNHWQLRDVTA